jgi:hypothetical protein
LSAGAIGSQFQRTALPSPVPLVTSTILSAPALPRVLAEITVESQHFYILVGGGPPACGVAMSAAD